MLPKTLLLSSILVDAGLAQRWTRTQRPSPSPTIPSPDSVQSLYGQCGGQNWTGPTRCPPGAYCRFDGNIWYQQCVAIESDSGQPTPTSTIRATTTIVVPGSTVVTTFITFLTPRPTTTTTTVTLVPDEPCQHEFLC